MRTNIVLDDDLVAEASRLSGIKTKKGLIREALRLVVLVDTCVWIEVLPETEPASTLFSISTRSSPACRSFRRPFKVSRPSVSFA